MENTLFKSKHFFFLCFAIFALMGSATAIGTVYFKDKQPECTCVKQLVYDTVVIHEDGTFEHKPDSICAVGGNAKGDLILTKFRDQ